jgi:hypothetical protein
LNSLRKQKVEEGENKRSEEDMRILKKRLQSGAIYGYGEVLNHLVVGPYSLLDAQMSSSQN